MSEAQAAAPSAVPSPSAPESAPSEGGEQAAAPVDPYASLDEVLKKAPVKYKAGGKERQVTSIRELLRKAEQADGIQSRAQELADREARAQAVLERDTRLKTAKTAKERIAILRELAGDAFDEAAEESVIERIEREKSMAGLSPSEREARQQLAETQARIQEYEAREAALKKQQEAEQEAAEETALAEMLAGHVVKALTAAGLPKEAAADGGRRLAFLLHRAEKLKLALTPEELAPKAVEMAARDFAGYTAKVDGKPLLDFVGMDTARRISKAYLAAMGHGAQTQAPPPAQASTPKQPAVRESPVTAWKKFGL